MRQEKRGGRGSGHLVGSDIAILAASKEVVYITTSTALLTVAIVSAAMAFTTLVLKIIEMAQSK